MGEAGWTRGAGGIYRNAAGAPFDIEVLTKEVTDNSIRRVQRSVSMPKAAGLNATGRGSPNLVLVPSEIPSLSSRIFWVMNDCLVRGSSLIVIARAGEPDRGEPGRGEQDPRRQSGRAVRVLRHLSGGKAKNDR